jgi:hypothetical protein
LHDVRSASFEAGWQAGQGHPVIDGKRIFSKSQLNMRIAIARDEALAIERIPEEEAYDRGYKVGHAEALDGVRRAAEKRERDGD